MEQLAERYWGSFGAAAVPGLSETEFDADSGEATAAGLQDQAAIFPPRPMTPARANYALDAPGEDVTITVNIGTRRIWPVRRQLQGKRAVVHIIEDIIGGESGEGITTRMRVDAIRFLSKIPAEIAMPSVELGIEEITFEWHYEDWAATASVEGDGLFGYALKRNGRFFPGEGSEALSAEELPNDLISYLKGLPTD